MCFKSRHRGHPTQRTPQMARITAASPLQRSILQCDEMKLHNWKTRDQKKMTDRGGGDAGVVVRPEARAIGNPIQECHGLAPSSEEVRATHLTTPSTKVKKVKSSQVERTEQNKSLTVTSRTECCMHVHAVCEWSRTLVPPLDLLIVVCVWCLCSSLLYDHPS